MAKKKYGIGSFFMDAVGVAAAPLTLGASLIVSPSAHELVGEVLGSFGGGSDDSSNQIMESWKLQTEQ